MIHAHVNAEANAPRQCLPRAISWRECALFLMQVALVVAVGTVDDAIHAVIGQGNVHAALSNAGKVAEFEIAHGLWFEPGIQAFFMHAHDVLGMMLDSRQLIGAFDLLYGLGHVGVTLAFALWMFLYRRSLFSFVRNIFLILNGLAVFSYEIFPLAPPRLAGTFHLDGRSYHFIDTIFGRGSGIHLSFNELAAMPSLHVGWALIVCISLVWVVRQPLVRAAALLWPAIMFTTVIVTGNHYIADSLGAACLLTVAVAGALLLEWCRQESGSLKATVQSLQARRWAQH